MCTGDNTASQMANGIDLQLLKTDSGTDTKVEQVTADGSTYARAIQENVAGEIHAPKCKA